MYESPTQSTLSLKVYLFPDVTIAFKTTGGIILGTSKIMFLFSKDRKIALVALLKLTAYLAPT